jgi:hypothetical protein
VPVWRMPLLSGGLHGLSQTPPHLWCVPVLAWILNCICCLLARRTASTATCCVCAPQARRSKVVICCRRCNSRMQYRRRRGPPKVRLLVFTDAVILIQSLRL